MDLSSLAYFNVEGCKLFEGYSQLGEDTVKKIFFFTVSSPSVLKNSKCRDARKI